MFIEHREATAIDSGNGPAQRPKKAPPAAEQKAKQKTHRFA